MRYVLRNRKLVPKHLADPNPQELKPTHGVMPDIGAFQTTDGVGISSRKHLRDYERATGLEQIGNDTTCGRNDDGSLVGRIVDEMPSARATVEEAMRRHS